MWYHLISIKILQILAILELQLENVDFLDTYLYIGMVTTLQVSLYTKTDGG